MKWLLFACLLITPVAAEENELYRELSRHLTPEQMARVRKTHSLEMSEAERAQGQAILDHIVARRTLQLKEAPRVDVEQTLHRWLGPEQVEFLERWEKLEREL